MVFNEKSSKMQVLTLEIRSFKSYVYVKLNVLTVILRLVWRHINFYL